MERREQLAWAAGLFDGEGWASAARYSRRTGGMTSTPVVGVGQADPEVLYRFRDAVDVGTVSGPYANGMYAFKAHGLEKAERIAGLLGPWLSTLKREQLGRVLADARQYRRLHPSKLFNREQVAEIKRRLAAGESQAAVAMSLGCQKQRINAIARGRSYRDAPEEIRMVAD